MPAPQVQSTTPVNGTAGVYLDTRPSVTLDSLDPASVDATTLALTVGSSLVEEPGKVEVSDKTVRFVPDTILREGTTYRLTLSPDVRSSSGTPLGTPYQVYFHKAGPLVIPFRKCTDRYLTL